MKPVTKLPRVLTAANLLRMIIVFVFCWLLISLTGCYTKKQAITKFCNADTVFTTDTQRTHTRDTLYFAGDTVTIHDSIKVDCIDGQAVFKPFTRTQKKGQILSKIEVDKAGNIKVDCMADSLMMVVDSLQKVISNNTTVTTHPKITTWNKAKAARWYIMMAFMLGLAVGLYITFKR